MYRTTRRSKSLILRRVGALAVIATLGGAVIAAGPASALPPRPGKHACTIMGADGTLQSFFDGSELEITITYPSGRQGKVHYRCDDGNWVKVAAIVGVFSGPVLSTGQLTTLVHSADVRLAVDLPGSSLKVIPTATPEAASGIA